MTSLACCPTYGAPWLCNVLASLRDILTAQPLPTWYKTSIAMLIELLLYASSPESALACGQPGYHPDVKRSIVLCRIYQKTLHWEAIVWNNNIFEIDHPLSACFINRLLPYSNLGKNTFLAVPQMDIDQWKYTSNCVDITPVSYLFEATYSWVQIEWDWVSPLHILSFRRILRSGFPPFDVR